MLKNQDLHFLRHQKQLFRDPENMKLAGVCSGLAAYFRDGSKLDESNLVWCNILGLFTAGIPLLPIRILIFSFWIILPKAETAQIFLKMKGKPFEF